jgi:hypothetical protein
LQEKLAKLSKSFPRGPVIPAQAGTQSVTSHVIPAQAGTQSVTSPTTLCPLLFTHGQHIGHAFSKNAIHSR